MRQQITSGSRPLSVPLSTPEVAAGVQRQGPRRVLGIRRSLAILSLLVCTSCARQSPSKKEVLSPDTRMIPFNGANTAWRHALMIADRPTLAPERFAATKLFAVPSDVPTDRLLLGQGLNS